MMFTMRRLGPFCCAVMLAGCGGGASAPAVTGTPIASASKLYVASWDRVSVFPAAGGPMERRITGIGNSNPGQAPNNMGSHWKQVHSVAALGDGTVITMSEEFVHPTDFHADFDVFDAAANGAASPRSSGSVGYPLAGRVALVPSSGQQFALIGRFGVEIYYGSSVDVNYGPNGPPRKFTPAYSDLTDVAVDRFGMFYVASWSAKLIAVYARGAQDSGGTPAPLRTLSTGAYPPSNVTVAPDGTVYAVVNALTPSSSTTFGVDVFLPGATAPSRVLGPFVKDGESEYIAAVAVDAQNELFVALDRPTHNRVVVFAPGGADAALREFDDPVGAGALPYGNGIAGIAVAP